MVRTFRFNSLPEAVRQRLEWAITSATPPYGPILREPLNLSIRSHVVLAIITFIVPLMFLMTGFGDLGKWGSWHGIGFAIFYAVAAVCFLLSIFQLLSVYLNRKSFPFVPGKYAFPLDFVDART